MGGILLIAVVVAIYLFLRPLDAATFAPLATLVLVGGLGAFDDYMNARTGEGIRARQKLIWLTVVAVVAAWQIQQTYAITAIAVPFVGAVSIDPTLYIAFAAFAIVAMANGVNLTDGLDGLAGGTLAFSFVAFMLVALFNVPQQVNLALLCALIIGALLGFLWFNVHPAQIFMGDAGALALGSTLAVTALITGQILILPLIGIIFVVETLSVIIQVAYFKLSGGKRIFRMSPHPPPLRAGWLGRGEDHDPLLDRRHPRGAARAHLLLRLGQRAGMSAMTEQRTIDPDALTMDSIRAGALRGRPVTVLGFARSGIALARFLADAGARVTVYDGRPAEELAGAIDALEGRDVRLALGPDVDPAATWADAALVTTSPSINPDYPTTEPRLRAALRALVEARAAGDPAAPALVSEPDLFLRLCPAPTVGVTGTKGKTTTASLTAALLAADPGHPAVLGGNIGVPIVERLPELSPDHRVVYELSELQLPTLSRGTTVAAYTNVTEDHIDRHGSLEAYRRVKRRLAELVDPDGALVLNADDPVVAVLRRSRDGPGRPLPLRSPDARRAWRGRRLDRRGRCAAADPGRRRTGGDRAGRPDPAARGARVAGPPQRLERPGRGCGRPAVRGRARRDPPRRGRLQRRRAPPRAGRRRRRRALRERLAGDAAGRGGGRARGVPGTGRADRRRPRQGDRPDVPCTGRREAGRRCRADRRERARARGPVPGRRAGPRRAGRVPRGGRPARRCDRA